MESYEHLKVFLSVLVLYHLNSNTWTNTATANDYGKTDGSNTEAVPTGYRVVGETPAFKNPAYGSTIANREAAIPDDTIDEELLKRDLAEATADTQVRAQASLDTKPDSSSGSP